ncbi:hypothetical protein NWE60_01535 [Mycoplasmopsis felis]|nr:hypothetical protein [Mycoplasmopsis felis]WAM01751.1 hypothetical protein NWE60_01535 [Mycoplasmopsis felis]
MVEFNKKPRRTCSGKGKIIQKSCSICKGKGYEKVLKTINIPVPQGAKEGMQVKLAGFGNPGKNSGFWWFIYWI